MHFPALEAGYMYLLQVKIGSLDYLDYASIVIGQSNSFVLVLRHSAENCCNWVPLYMTL